MKQIFVAAATMAWAALAMPLAAQAQYPERDIRVVVPWGAGGGTDAIARKLTEIAEGEIGGTMYVENIEGGVSATGISQVMRAQADGYTLGILTYDSVVTIPWQGLLPSYKLENLKLVARVTSEPDALVVDADSEYESLEQMLAAAEENPQSIRVGVQNLGGRTHLALLQLQELAGVEFQVISYPGGAGPQKEAILSGEIVGAVTSLGDFSNLLQDGTVEGLAEFSSAPNPTYPDVPLAKDQGVDLEIGSFIVLAVPAETPDEVVSQIEAAYQAAYDSDEFQDWVANVGVTPSWLGTDEVTAWAEETQQTLFEEMDALVEQGILTK